MKENQLDSLFRTLSKLTIFIPIAIVVIAVFIKFNSEKKPTNTLKAPVSINNVNKKKDVFSSLESTVAAKLDFSGNYQCRLETKEASISAYIKNNKIYAEIVRESLNDIVIINNDCFYHWQKNKYLGEKMCNFNQMMSFAKTFLGLNPMSIFEGMLPSNSDIEKACQKKDSLESVFIVPTNISFKEVGLSDFQDLGLDIIGK